MTGAHAAGFLAAILPLVLTPGASLALLTRHVTASGRRQALPVTLGTCTGIYLHALLALMGLSAVVTSSSEAFAVVKLVGALYLVGLGLWTWRSARHVTQPSPPDHGRPRWGGDSPYLQSLLGNVLNPKAAAIYLTLAPQFVTESTPLTPQLLTLATGHVALTTAWLLGWTALLSSVGRVLATPRARALLARITGCVLVGLGVRAAL